jgi:hypothetical protein
MASKAALEYRATVAFFLEGVPHHAAGTWQASKICAKRDTAHRALSFFVGRWGEELMKSDPNDDASFEDLSNRENTSESTYEERLLECFCAQLPSCTGSLKWDLEIKDNSSENKEDQCFAVVEVPLLGVPHKLAGAPKDTDSDVHYYGERSLCRCCATSSLVSPMSRL